MKHSKLILFFLIFCYITSASQVMNVRKWRKAERDSLDNGMYLIEENQYLQALPIFDALLASHPNEEFLRYTYAKCALYRADKHEDAYTYLTELYQKNKKVADIQYDVALASHYNYKFDEATEYINRFLENKRITPEQKNGAAMLLIYIANARKYYNTPTQAKLKNLGPEINTADDEYVPAITADESKLIFTYAGEKSVGGRQNQVMQPDPYGDFLEDIYMSNKEGKAFKAPKPIENLNTNLPDAAVSINNDGTVLFLYQDIADGHGDLYQSNLTGESFSKPAKLKGEVNSYSWDGHCSLSPDGKTIYFSSDRGGGYGGRDLYKATLLPDSVWGNAQNLGDSVNTPYDEDAPFIHPDGVTLYYSSNGQKSMGGYDVFRASMSFPDSAFKRTENLGYPINSASDDKYFVVSADNTHGYYSSARKDGFGKNDLYMVETNFTDARPAVYLVKGKTTDNNVPVEAEIKVEVVTGTSRIYKSFRSNSKSGDYLVTLPAGASYMLSYTYPGKDRRTLNVDALVLSRYAEKVNNVDFTLPPVPDVIAAAPPAAATSTQAATSLTPAAVASSSPVTGTTGATAPAKTVPSTTAAAIAAASKTTAPASTPAAAPQKTTGTVAANTSPAPASNTSAATYSNGAVVAKGSDFPKTPLQEKTMRYVEKYGKVSAPELEFKIQIAAVKTSTTNTFPNQKQLGAVEKLMLGDGYTRITVGGSFSTIEKAYEHNRKVVKAGQPEGYVIALYKGQRVAYDYLEEIGIFK